MTVSRGEAPTGAMHNDHARPPSEGSRQRFAQRGSMIWTGAIGG